MLYQNAVPTAALGVLKKVSAFNQLKSFALGEGTTLALRLGHRLSVDLDFFTNTSFDTSALFQLITKEFSSAELLFEQNQTMLFSIDDIKVDFVSYPFPWLRPFDMVECIRLISLKDNIPMKLQAAGNRNAKKDYWDIATLLTQYPLDEMLKIFKIKFPQIDTGYIVHSLTDFEKADTEPDPDIYANITWDEIKLLLRNEVKKYTGDLL